MKLLKSYIKLNISLIIIVVSIIYKEFIFNLNISNVISKKLAIFDSLSVIFIYFILSIIFKKKYLIYLYLIDVFFSILIFANLIFYRAYGDFLTIGLFMQIKQLSSVGGSVLSLIHLKDFIFLIDLPVLYYFIFKKISNKEIELIDKIKGASCTFLICAVYVIFILIKHPNQLKVEFTKIDIFNNYGIIGMYIIDNYNYCSNNIIMNSLSKEDENNINKEMKISDIKFPKENKKSNLIMIQVESLQQFIIGKTHNGKEITPFLNKLIRESAYFDNCYYQIGLGHTADAELLTNTSLYPLNDGAAHIIKYNNKYNALANIMNKQGYKTAALHGNSGDYFNRNTIFKDYGFNDFYDLNKFKQDEIIEMGLSDNSFFNQSEYILEKFKQPFYSFLITITSHSPFKVNNDFCETNTNISRYYNAINYTDKCIGLFLDKLDKDGTLNNSVIVIYGDHNAITSDNKNELSQEVEANLDENYSWQKYQKVPLIIRFPNGKNKGIYTNSVGQVDIMPTILDIFGISGIKHFGNDVFQGMDNQVILRDGSYVIGNNFYDNKSKTTYDMLSGKKIRNDNYLIQRARNQLKASDNIFKYDYFSR